MTSTGGTSIPLQISVSQNQTSAYSCSHCSLMFESSTSLQVHMHYQHENQSRWGSSPSNHIQVTSAPSSTTPTDTETNNNNQPLSKHHIKASPPHQNTIAAAADSSGGENPPTPQPSHDHDAGTPQSFQSSGSPYPPAPTSANELQHHTAAYSSSNYPTYEGLYYHNLEYGQPAHHQQQEYKQTVPSSRYQPYNSSNNHNSTSQNSSSNSSTNSSVQITNNSNGLSPRVVSSTSPTQTSASPSQNSSAHIMHIPPGQPTPSPSPKQCDKCGVVCETDGQLIEHSQVAHSDHVNGSVLGHIKSEEQQQHNYPPFPPSHHHHNFASVKDEPSSDILDLDSQKMVYPPHPDGALPPMHSLHPLQPMQRHPMIWSHHDAHFIPPPHPGAHYHQATIKPEYPPTPPISHMKAPINEYSPILPPTPVSMKQEYNHIKSEYSNQNNSLPPASTISKSFNSDLSDTGSQLTTSPSDFPSTTTPQENGNGQFQRSFEPPSSTHPQGPKSSGWKSNEARRPKTYNCTACNKWFTSSGHLKRHYNTTLHKNAVKSSGQPDPATLPISAHHHPQRDPNYIGKRRSHHQRNQANQQQQANQQAQQQSQNQTSNQVTTTGNQQTSLQQQTISAENTTRSPDYQPQFTLPSFGSPAALQQGFQQYGSSNLHNPSGNGQAGENQIIVTRSVQKFQDYNLEYLKFLK
ncbi:hypothetical protein PVAND_003591 [Polypedilum vanderplanki]|uniref:C2H2-type domain-containing protein n=1 Tax=Polypedilum vanderplanki TaxID=319348 RepID=A0A9J6BUH9_POLVA|nr:hypothetical protein PVAND_003591 [Polypedilum vanderplanki]